MRKMIIGGLLCVLMWACGPPLPQLSKGRIIRTFWNDGSRGEVGFGDALKRLKAESFPLKLTFGALGPDVGLPREGQAGVHTYKLSTQDLDKPLQLVGLKGEGAVVVWDAQGKVVDKLLYMPLPNDTIVVRDPAQERLCKRSTWQQGGGCTPQRRPKDIERLRVIRSEQDFRDLAKVSGKQGLQIQEVKFIIDLKRDGLPHFINSRQWDLHYTWIREKIEKLPHLDRCDPKQNSEFNKGWYDFSDKNYFNTDTRRYLLGTIIYYEGPKKYAMEFAVGDRIKYVQVVQAYRILREVFPASLPLPVRPMTAEQEKELFHTNPDKIPTMPIDLPYQGQTTQLLSPGLAYGKLVALSRTEVASHPLGLRTIALLTDVPNDINFVGGIISTHFQSALSHINVLSRNRGTPHLVLKDALTNPKSKALIGKLVRLEVTQDGYSLTTASQAEAEAFWAKKASVHKPWKPTRDLSVKTLVDLADSSYKASTIIGAKAANLAELAKVNMSESWHSVCRSLASQGFAPVPKKPFAIPFYWYVDHLKRSGYAEKLDAWHQDKRFLEDATYRNQKLAELRAAIQTTPVNPALLTPLKAEIKKRFGDIKVRFRSSTNVEDLPNFNGAGLYTSKSGQLNNPKKSVERALQIVWSSLWAERAWSERTFYKIDHTQAAMGILVHPSFPTEAANGVSISTNIFRPDYSNDTYVVVQLGSTSVVNPTNNATPDQFLLRWYQNPETVFLSYSSLTHGDRVLSRQETLLLGCYMQAIHQHFRPIFEEKGKPFAMDVEFKIDSYPRKLYFKQARPYIFGEHQGEQKNCN